MHMTCIAFFFLNAVVWNTEWENSTFWLASSSRSLACSWCIRLSSSCWFWSWSCTSKDLLPLHSTGEFSALRDSALRPNLMSRSKGFLARDGLRPKSKVNVDPKESERGETWITPCRFDFFYKPLIPTYNIFTILSKRVDQSKTMSNWPRPEGEKASGGVDVRLCASGWCLGSGQSLGGASTSSHSSVLLLPV